MGFCFSREEEEEDETAWQKPQHYRNREGPKYQLLNFTKDYHYRKYEPSTCICVRMNGVEYKKALSKGSSLLSKYFAGHNGPEIEMKETCPVRVQIDFKQNLEDVGDFVVAMHLPWENMSRPPAPKHPDMFIQDFREEFAYSVMFEGVPSEAEIKEHLKGLCKTLEREGVRYERYEYFSCRFESPMSFKKKTHEVMVLARKPRSQLAPKH